MTKAQWYQLAFASLALIPASGIVGTPLGSSWVTLSGAGIGFLFFPAFMWKGVRAGRRETVAAVEQEFNELTKEDSAKIGMIFHQKDGGNPLCWAINGDHLGRAAFTNACDRAANMVPWRLKRRVRAIFPTKCKGLPLWFLVLEYHRLREHTAAEVLYSSTPQGPQREIQYAPRASVIACRKIRELL